MRRNVKKIHAVSKNVLQKQVSELQEAEETLDVASDTLPSSPLPRTFLRRFLDNLSHMKYVILLLLIPPILNFGSLQRESVVLAPEGQKIDMGWGQKMFIHCKGEGLLTVLLDAPTGVNSDIWLFVHEPLSQLAKVCVYDRSGIGSSDSTFKDVSKNSEFVTNDRFIAQSSTVRQMVNDLHHLVKQINPFPQPLILVGAEMGSLIARMYSIHHAQEVAGIILIDPVVENSLSESPEWSEFWYSRLLPNYQSLHLSAMAGVSRLAILLGLLHPTYFVDGVSDEIINRQKSLLCNPWHINSAFQEHLMMNTSFQQMRNDWIMNQFPDNISVSVVRRNQPNEIPSDLHDAWIKSQQYLVDELHPNCHKDVIEESSFLRLYENPTPIIDEVKRVITEWKRKKSLL